MGNIISVFHPFLISMNSKSYFKVKPTISHFFQQNSKDTLRIHFKSVMQLVFIIIFLFAVAEGPVETLVFDCSDEISNHFLLALLFFSVYFHGKETGNQFLLKARKLYLV